ncbi:hypothetical protein MPER_03745, partial [Moniliophthora perniciosa FA553]
LKRTATIHIHLFLEPWANALFLPWTSFLPWLIKILQIVALVAYVLAYFPGGTQTLRMGGSLALRGAGSLLPR